MKRFLAPDDILTFTSTPDPHSGEEIGVSREGRPLFGYRFGRGPLKVSLIAGCHADEPVGPAMLDRLVNWFLQKTGDDPILQDWSFFIVPHANPDGEARNRAWTESVDLTNRGACYDLVEYLGKQIRELPGDDVEFGFPRQPDDLDARPENLAIAEFLRSGSSFVLHASFHGMAFAAGPWFLIEHSWADRTLQMRQDLRERVQSMNYQLHDIDRKGDKGFFRIDEGFTSRPDSRAMVRHFEELGDFETAKLFRPSSMEFARSLGGDPLTLVSEMPLFLLPADLFRQPDLIRPKAIRELTALASAPQALRQRAKDLALRPMPIIDQMKLQLSFLETALIVVDQSKPLSESATLSL